MLVREFMSTQLYTLHPDMLCEEARIAFRKKGIRRAPVVRDGLLVGIVSMTDLVRRDCWDVLVPETEVAEAMTTQVISVSPNDHLEEVAHLMYTKKVGGIPVVDGNELRGIITESDIFKALVAMVSRDRGTRILFEIGPDAGTDLTEYIWLCMKNQCPINGLLTHPRPLGGTLVFLGLEGGRIDDLVTDLWAKATNVIKVQRVDPELELSS